MPSPNVGRHDDSEYGTHHARDARHVFQTQGVDLDLFSSAVKVNTQYMHSIWYRIVLKHETTLKEVVEKLRANPLVAMTDKKDANVIFSFGRDHGYYGRILSQTVVVVPTITVRHGREIYGFCFTPQDGNSLLSSVAAALWRIDPNWDSVSERLAPLGAGSSARSEGAVSTAPSDPRFFGAAGRRYARPRRAPGGRRGYR